MRGREIMRKNRNLQAILAAVAACGLSTAAYGQTQGFYGTSFDNSSEVEGTGPYASPANAIPAQYLPIVGAGSPAPSSPPSSQNSPSFNVDDISGANVPLPYDSGDANPYEEVVQVNSDLQINLFDDTFVPETSQTNITLFFYMATDTTTPINVGENSPLAYQTTSTYSGGLNAPGQTGSFVTGSTIYFLGTGIYNDAITNYNTDNIPFSFNLTLPSLATTYVAQQINDGGNIRIVMATNNPANNGASFLSYGNSDGFTPGATFDLVTENVGSLQVSQSLSANNNSTLWLGQVGTKTLPVINLGAVVQGVPITASFTIGNSGTDPAQFRAQTGAGIVGGANSGADGSVVYSDPVAPGSSSNIVVGFSAVDTAYLAGSHLTAALVLENTGNSNDAPDIIEVATTPVQLRYIDSSGPSSNNAAAPNFGNVLVGATVSMPVSVTTINPLPSTDGSAINGFDFSTNSLNMETLLANVKSFNVHSYDPYSGATLGVFSANSPSYPQVFNNNQVGTVTSTLVVETSGESGNSVTFTISHAGAGIKTYGPGLTIFENANTGTEAQVQGQGIPGEYNSSDTVYVYGQWDGFQTASLVSSATAALGPGATGTITNATGNDNILTLGSFTYDLSQRATAWLTSVNFNQNGWSQSGLTPVVTTGSGTLTTVTSGTTIMAPIPKGLPDGQGSANGTTATYTLSQASSGLLNGTYGATMSVQTENDQSIQGSAHNDLPLVTVALQSVYTGDTLNGAGSYTLTGGTFSSSAPTALSGSFNQSGGTSSFASLSGSGQVTLAGGAMSVSGGTFTGSILDNSSLTVAGPTAIGSLNGTGGLTLTGGSVQLGANGPGVFTGSTSNSAALTVLGGTSLSPNVLGNISGPGTLAVGTGATAGFLKLNANSHTSTVGGLTVATNSILDINNNTLIVTFPTGGSGGSDPINSIVGYLTSGYNGGNWKGTTGIVSSPAASGQLSPLLSIGYADGGNPLDLSRVPGLQAGEVEIKYTLAGDAILAGTVNFNDLLIVAQDFNKTGEDWAGGNFIYNPTGLVNFNDLLIVAQNFNKTLTPAGSSSESVGSNISSLDDTVPEPGSITLMVGAGAGLLARRRRRSRA
jgi:hypothetical protein